VIGIIRSHKGLKGAIMGDNMGDNF
jgi:hypothetical protein